MGLFGNDNRRMDIMLTEEDFRCLVRGGVLRVNDRLKIALQDIGFDRMDSAIQSARHGIELYKPRDRETNDGKGWENI